MATRRATHAGTWYTGNKHRLESQLEMFLDNVPTSGFKYEQLPVPGARFLVGPHAGYAYAGQTLAQTYKAWDLSNIKRVFILGPSHHVFFRGGQLTAFSNYETPLGDIPVDVDMVQELQKTGIFGTMSATTDEDEHSFEMHMPFIYKMGADSPEGVVRPIVPILIGHSTKSYEKQLADVLAPYFEDKQNAFIISTDFCHWGSRFDYTAYTTMPDGSDLKMLSRSHRISKDDVPIYKSIEILDKLGMDAASTGSYDKFNEYIEETENTICGRHPLAILLKTVENVKKNGNSVGSDYGSLKWIGYAQSSPAIDVSDSSVSYASGFAVA